MFTRYEVDKTENLLENLAERYTAKGKILRGHIVPKSRLPFELARLYQQLKIIQMRCKLGAAIDFTVSSAKALRRCR